VCFFFFVFGGSTHKPFSGRHSGGGIVWKVGREKAFELILNVKEEGSPLSRHGGEKTKYKNVKVP